MRLASGARDANAEWLGARVLYLMPDSWKTFMAFLEAKFPRLVARYREWYGRNVDAPEVYRKEMAARDREAAPQISPGLAAGDAGGAVLAFAANAARTG